MRGWFLRSRGESFFMPTKDCLVDLSEPPFFMLDTNELEIAYFERVSHNLKYFDMVFVCKDYETWVRIDAIPSKKLENVKTWIDSINVRTQPFLPHSVLVPVLLDHRLVMLPR